MVNYVECKPGNIYVLTEKGSKISRIKAKFNKDHPHCKRYTHNVPQQWVDKGYVIEVKAYD